jgi:hypothetical protein
MRRTPTAKNTEGKLSDARIFLTTYFNLYSIITEGITPTSLFYRYS